MKKPSDADKKNAAETQQSEFGFVFPDPLFRYTDEQWVKISAELPEDLYLDEIGFSDLDGLRFNLEMDCNGYLFLLNINIRNYQRRLDLMQARLANNARSLLESWPPDLAFTFDFENDCEEIPEPLLEDLKRLVEQLEDKAKSSLPLRKGPHPMERNILVSNLIWVWEAIGGNVGTSTSADGRRAGGPLIRFIIAAANPVLEQKLTPHAARALVRKYKEDHKPLEREPPPLVVK